MDDVAGLLLIGGKSKRMGYKKELLPIHKKTLENHMLHIFHNVGIYNLYYSVSENNVSNTHTTPACVIQDLYKNRGPLGGIHSVLTHISKKKTQKTLLVLPIDMPLLTKTLLQQLIKNKNNNDVCIFKGKNLPCCISVNKKIITISEKLLKTNKNSISVFFTHLKVNRITNYSVNYFLNMNTPKKWVFVNNYMKQ